MKRSAAEAGFPAEGQTIRVTVCVPADRCTRNEPMTIPLVCHNSDNVDAVKKLLTCRIKEITGRCPQLPCFQSHQNGRHVPFTEPITSLATLAPVHFVRTALGCFGSRISPGHTKGLRLCKLHVLSLSLFLGPLSLSLSLSTR